MKFKAGEIVSLKHYSIDNNNKGIISKTLNDGIIVKPEKEFLIYSFFDSDPVVIGFESENTVNLCESTVSSVDYKDNTFELTINNIQSIENKRISQRFPVSMCAYVKADNSSVFSYIRNIGLNGISLCSKYEFKKGDMVSVDTAIFGENISFMARVAWKKLGKVGFEYGLEFYSPSPEFDGTIEKCIKLLKQEQKSAINRLKYDFKPIIRMMQKNKALN